MSTTASSEIERTTAAVLLLTVEEAAQRLSIGRTTMYSLVSTGVIKSVTIGRLRPKYEHGCGDTCGRKAGYCPEREQTRADTGPTKSRAGRRVIGLPAPLVLLLQAHKAKQEAEGTAARQLWHNEGWVFANPDGRPLNPNTDYHEWKALLSEAGVHDGRLHDARHTAATVLEGRCADAYGHGHHGMVERGHGHQVSARARFHPQGRGWASRRAALGCPRERPSRRR